MSEYTELCRELRNTERICRDRMGGTVMLEAADAIEALQRACDNYAEMATEQEWIPVTERLPEKGKYLVCKRYDNGYGVHHSLQILSFTDNLNKVDKYDFPGKEYKRPGWFDYDSEYGHFECGDNITHYMPLPTPPKEEQT